jgi:hypothetical protein
MVVAHNPSAPLTRANIFPNFKALTKINIINDILPGHYLNELPLFAEALDGLKTKFIDAISLLWNIIQSSVVRQVKLSIRARFPHSRR